MNRRNSLIALFSLGAASGLRPAWAQQGGAIPMVGLLSLGTRDRENSFREGLRKLGYVEGRNIRLVTRVTDGRYTRLEEIAEEFARMKVDVVVAIGASAAQVAKKTTPNIPVVFVMGNDPVREKLALSLSKPGGNVTGVTLLIEELTLKRIELLKEVLPGLKRLGLVQHPESRASAAAVTHAREATRILGLQLEIAQVRTPNDFDNAFESLAKRGVTIFVGVSSLFQANREQFLSAAARHKLVGVFHALDWMSPITLFCYGQSLIHADRHAATYVDKILKGAKAGDLPIEQPTVYDFVVNLKLAKTLGITIPPSVLVRATKVIE